VVLQHTHSSSFFFLLCFSTGNRNQIFAPDGVLRMT
jgi:hypothetical protein